ncbi:class GN sortase [Enterovibrio paralichthyis]|uniref:class GN sortase n=1 Tax=Enterovibrio paralichthyis TaxID=2853805 RepID=UPI001C4949DD|nr:class GN sortase [Enterovibrio paralichthyis]MBV7296843.1 class GN sortase [Enterovibrio paralichthyis]
MQIAKRIGMLLFIVGIASGGAMIGKGIYIKTKALVAQVLIERAWDKQKMSQDKLAPWPWADTYPAAKLIFGENRPLWVLSGANARNLAFGPTLQMNTAEPGRRGNVVIFGHNDTHFSGLQSAKKGDIMALETRSGTNISYKVTAINVVHESDTKWIENSGEDRLTLVTCYPSNVINSNQRLVVIATPVIQGEDQVGELSSVVSIRSGWM